MVDAGLRCRWSVIPLHAQLLMSLRIETSSGADDDGKVDPHAVYERLGSALRSLAGFRILPRVVLGNFAFQKMAMVRDLQENGDLIEQHDVISAIAGDDNAKGTVRAAQESMDGAELDNVPPADEFLVLDADSSQQAAIRAILKGQTAVVIGPPGTGKSQTIANLIAELSARGRRILFVAEKRVALEVVVARLRGVGLGHLALDLHGAGITRKEVMKQFSESLDLVRNSLVAEDPATHENLIDRRTRLNQHASRLHSPRLPCGLSAFDIMGRLLRASSDVRSRVRWRGTELDCISKEAAQEIRDLLIELGGFSGLLWMIDPSPWFDSAISDGMAAQEAVDAVTRLQGIWPALRSSVAAVSTEAQMHEPKTLEQLTELLDVLGQIGSSVNIFGPKIFDEDLEFLTKTLAHGRNIASHLLAWSFSKQYREAYRTVAAFYTGERRTSRQLYQDLSTAMTAKKRWSSLVPGAQVPVACPSLPRCQKELAAAQTAIKKLASLLGRHDLSRLTLQELGGWIDRLASDLFTPYQLVRFLDIERRLVKLGAGPIIAEIREQRPPAEVWPKLFDYAWLASSFDQALAQDAELAGFNGWTRAVRSGVLRAGYSKTCVRRCESSPRACGMGDGCYERTFRPE